MTETLTRTDQVVAVLNTGGKVALSDNGGLMRLFDHAGTEVPAWQQAIKAGAKKAKPAAFNAHKALGWIQTAKNDILRGDLLDALDSLGMAANHIRDARLHRAGPAGAARKG